MSRVAHNCTKERRRFVIAFVNKGSLDAIGTRLPIDQPSLRMLSDVDAMCQNYLPQKKIDWVDGKMPPLVSLMLCSTYALLGVLRHSLLHNCRKSDVRLWRSKRRTL